MNDTICAISTSLGVGAISIIRISGSDAIKIVNSIFSNDLTKANSHTIHYGKIIDGKEIVDEVLVMLMRSPKTYTTEDIVEINSHGGVNTTNRILELLLKKGCRLAEPGEFTKRAFLNGRINLLESEAVNELINAKTDSQRKLSLNQIGGNLTKKINNIRELLLSLMANIEVNIDYPEYEDNLIITEELLKEKLVLITNELDKLVEGAKIGKLVRNGVNIAIVGKPNVGKSSVLNNLLDEEKAIVTDIAGTTRDLIEGYLTINGMEVKLIDTAGIRDTEDVVEKIGVDRSKKVIDESDVVLMVIDGSKGITKEDKEILATLDDKKTIILINKTDISNKDLKLDFKNVVKGNTKDIDGLDNLKKKIAEMLNIDEINKDLTYLSNARQTDLVNKASNALKEANKSIKNNVPIDMIESNLKECYNYLGEIIGDTYEEAVIDRLFHDFCVGK
jgi:tRNA modification GTPase